MLKTLSIENLATIEALALDFGPGLNALTGETGAGKSILVGALSLALGERASADAIRPGERLAVVEAAFAPARPADLLPLLRGELELEWEPPEPLVLRRELSAAGRNRCFIGGQMVGVAELKRLGERLVDFHGQHEHQSLLRPAAARAALDAFAGHDKLVAAYETAWRRAADLRRRRRDLEEAARNFDQRADYLDFQLNEIEKLDPQSGELESLAQEEHRLTHADALARAAAEAYSLLYEGGEGSGESRPSLLGILREVERRLGEIAAVERNFTDPFARLADHKVALEDLAFSLRDYAETVQADPRRLDEVIARLEALRRLVRKHGGEESALFAARDAMRAEREQMTRDDVERRTIEADLAIAESELRRAGEALGDSRRRAADRFAKTVARLLAELHMEKAVFETRVDHLDAPAADGLDAVEFLLSANPGLPPAPLRRIASGGELSRVMLALKSVLAAKDSIPTLVFDEIDVGLSGETVVRVGRLMEKLAASHQILCVTHHAPIAARAARHALVRKAARRGKTFTEIELLAGDARLSEIAKMIGGDAATPAGLELARELMA